MSGKKYVPEGIYLVCDKGSKMSELKSFSYKETTLFDENMCTISDKKLNINFDNFGSCACNNYKTCTAPVTDWTNFTDSITLGGNELLLENSELPCTLGGTIKIYYSMQAAMAAVQERKKGFWGSLFSSVLEVQQTVVDFEIGVAKGLWKGLKGTVVGIYDLTVWAGKHTVPYMLLNPSGYAEQLQKDKETFTAIGNAAKKGGTWVYRNSSINLITNPADYAAAQQENAVMMGKLYDKASEMNAEEWGDFTGQVLFEVGLEVATVGAASALTAVKVADKTVDVVRAIDKLDDLADGVKALDKADDIIDGTRLPELPDELGDVVHFEGLRPADFGVSMLADNPELLKIWNDTLKKIASSKRNNKYKEYLQNLENGVEMSNTELSNTYKYVRQVFKEQAESAGHVIDGELHHWNFPKNEFPDQITNPKNLTEPIDRATHEAIHDATSSGTNKFVDPINPMHELPINNMKL